MPPYNPPLGTLKNLSGSSTYKPEVPHGFGFTTLGDSTSWVMRISEPSSVCLYEILDH